MNNEEIEGVITVTKIAKGKGPFYNIQLSEGEGLRVSEDILVRYRLLKGQEISQQIIDEIRQSGGYDYGLQMAMNYLSYQLRTEKEIRTYLKDKEIEREDRDKIVAKLKELTLIDDLIYAESYVRTQVRISDKGPQTITQQLRQKGVKADEIEQALSLYPKDSQVEIALRTAEKALKKIHGKSQRETVQKVRQTLMQKGFSSEVITGAMESIEFEKDEDEEYAILVQQGDKLWRRHARLNASKRNQKIKQSLYQKGYSFDDIQRYLDEKEESDD
ncbi:recombination regulator RecX [Enterococcus sp. JM4C]|uniref:recombination regulator RecX n=1 Tax=Candidatus Enterococcus huntleyi TaxID=1857217 RepID=UPI00137971AB|nr:recombination regulator RecX [Enterococcus sp. JM4C]KAF1297266.1 recombination regulator RecX [Enterococcus sp. JM4C]